MQNHELAWCRNTMLDGRESRSYRALCTCGFNTLGRRTRELALEAMARHRAAFGA